MLTLSDVQDVHGAGDLRQTLLDAIQPGMACRIDISAVTTADISFVQVIEAARKTAANLGGSLSLTAPAPRAVIDVLTRAGLLARPGPADMAFWTQDCSLQGTSPQ